MNGPAAKEDEKQISIIYVHLYEAICTNLKNIQLSNSLLVHNSEPNGSSIPRIQKNKSQCWQWRQGKDNYVAGTRTQKALHEMSKEPLVRDWGGNKTWLIPLRNCTPWHRHIQGLLMVNQHGDMLNQCQGNCHKAVAQKNLYLTCLVVFWKYINVWFRFLF